MCMRTPSGWISTANTGIPIEVERLKLSLDVTLQSRFMWTLVRSLACARDDKHLCGVDRRADAMQAGRAVRHLIAKFADLQLAIFVRRPHHDLRFAGLLRHPVISPETPGDWCARLVNLGVLPGFAVIGADLYFRDAVVAAESHPAQLVCLADYERLREMIAPDLRSEERRV